MNETRGPGKRDNRSPCSDENWSAKAPVPEIWKMDLAWAGTENTLFKILDEPRPKPLGCGSEAKFPDIDLAWPAYTWDAVRPQIPASNGARYNIYTSNGGSL